jgi:biotin carboxyl carrier protein
MELRYLCNDLATTVRVEKSGAGYVVTVNAQTFTVDAARMARPGELWFSLSDQQRVAFVAAEGPRRWVALDGQSFAFSVANGARRVGRAGHAAHDSLEAQMPGVVRKVQVSAGDRVEVGQALLVLEAMKMEIRVSAPHAGVVERILVREGQTVERGQVLVELRALTSPA